MSGFLADYRVCFPNQKVYVAKDHNWAFAAWEIANLKSLINRGATLFHVDAHLDDIWDGIQVPGLKTIQTEADAFHVAGHDMMKIENFIWAGFATDAVDKVIYVSPQYADEDIFDISKWDQETLQTIKDLFTVGKKYDGYRVCTIEELQRAVNQSVMDPFVKGKPLILDLDLDYFNDSKSMFYSKLRPEHEILDNLEYLKSLYDWDLITVALSPAYCGPDDECEYLYGLFLKVFGLNLKEAIIW